MKVKVEPLPAYVEIATFCVSDFEGGWGQKLIFDPQYLRPLRLGAPI